jgi:CelD/BcsL family acetyltransferase involved in cellulose biosynthesis
MSDTAAAGLSRRAAAPSAATLAPVRPALEAEIVEGMAACDALAEDWRRLAARQASPTLFQSPEILDAWARRLTEGTRLATIVVRSDGRPMLIWPLAIERRSCMRIARGAGAPVAQYDELLLDPEVDRRAAIATAYRAARTLLHLDVILVERVRADSALRQLLRDVTPLCADAAAPFCDLSQGAEHALATLKPTVGRRQRKRVRRFHKEGDVTFALAGSPAEAAAWLGEALALKRHWLQETGRISRAFLRAETGDCLADLARALWNAGAAPRMIVSRLALDGRPAAFEVGFRHGSDYYLYLRAFAPDLAPLGPGNVLTEYMFGWCAADDVTRYDMLAPRSRNKSEWQSGEVPVMDFALPLSAAGRFYVEAILKRLLPAARGAFYALPAKVRSAVAGATLRM